MRPLRLALHSFTSFRQSGKEPLEVDFSGLDLVVIAGPMGSGKSSLLDAMIFALYGKVPRVGKGVSELIALGRDRMGVTLDFQLGERTFRAVRVVRRGGRATTAQLEELKGGEEFPLAEGVTEVEKAVQSLLGLNYEAFTQSVILPQGEFQKFLRSAPRDRRQILTELLRLGIYDRMRKRAEEEAQKIAALVASQEGLVAQEYADATPEALTALEDRLQGIKDANKARSVTISERDRLLSELRLQHQKTTELRQSRKRVQELAAKETDIAAVRKRLEDARRAIGVVPLLDTLAKAKTRASAEDERLREARKAHATGVEAHDLARKALATVEREAEEIPSVEERLQALDQIVGLLDPLAKARLRLEEVHADLERAKKDLVAARKAHEAAEGEARRLTRQAKALRESLEKVAYDGDAHGRLEDLRDAATHLGVKRGEVAKAAGQLKEAEAAHAKAEEERKRREDTAKSAGGQLAAVVALREEAEQALREGEREHAAAHLRKGLKKGEPCPVCEHRVQNLPGALSATSLERVQKRLEGAKGEETRVRSSEARHREDAARAAEAANRTLESWQGAKKALDVARSALDQAEGRLLADAGTDLGDARRKTPPEERLRDALEAFTEQKRQHERAAAALLQAQRGQDKAIHETDKTAGRVKSLEEGSASLSERLSKASADVKELEARIAAISKDPDPRSERARLAQRREALAEALKKAQKTERDTADTGGRAAVELKAAAESGGKARAAVADATKEADAALRQGQFRDEASARKAFVPLEDQEHLSHDVECHGQERHALELRVKDLTAELGGTEVQDETLQKAEDALAQLRKALEEGTGEQASLEQQLREMGRRVQAAATLKAQVDQQRSQHSVYSRLSIDLRSQNFQAYLLEEVFRELVRGASERLMSLSGRYTFDFHEDSFHVLDHDNARERRSAETLSGGETFLASLALALELSQQIQRAAGAVHLDSLFIDEGFGTLDPETLETVSDAIFTLPVAGRLVGIITHIPELADRLPARIQVEKRPEGSGIAIHRA